MIRNLKVLGLALAAVLVLGAVGASGASATALTSDGPVTLVGHESGTNALTALGGSVECPESIYTGHKYNVTPHELIPSGATTVTITPHFVTHCKAVLPVLGEREATVTMNECDFVIHLGPPVSADLVCPTGHDIEIHIYKLNPASHTESEEICHLTITPQAGLTGTNVAVTNGTEGHIDLTGAFENIEFHHNGSACGTGTNTNGKLDTSITIEGHGSEGEATAVSVS